MPKPLTLVASFERFPGLPPRSTERLKYERFMHYFHYPYIIHPYSRFRYYWDCLMCFSVLSHVIISTLISDFIYHGNFTYHSLTLGFQIHGFVDIILNFLTGYAKKSNKTVILQPSKIALNYLKTWLVIDVLSILPYESLSVYIPNCYASDYNEVFTCHFYADVFSVTFLLRIFSFQRYFRKIAMLNMISVFRAQAIVYVFWMLGIAFAINNINALIPFYYPDSNSTWTGIPYFYCKERREQACEIFHSDPFLYLMSALSFWEENLIYFKDFETADVVIRIIFHYFYVIALTAFAAFIINCVICNKFVKDRYYEREGDVRSFLSKKPLTKAISDKVLLYYQVFFEKNMYEEEILEFLPESELEKITVSSTLPIVQNVQLFLGFPKELLRKVAYVTRNEIYLPHDVLVRAGDIGRSMFVIRFGTVAIYSKKFVKLTEFDDGDYFGVKSIIFPMKLLNASAVASKICSVCRLDRDDFLAIMQFYPGYLDRLQRQLLAEKEIRG